MSHMVFSVTSIRFVKGISLAVGLLMAFVSLAPAAMAQSAGHFLPPHADSGVDTDGDSLYNFLHLDINVESTTPGLFFVFSSLMDGTNSTTITTQSTSFFLDGIASISIDLDGIAIRSSAVDGPYQANLYLYNDSSVLQDYNEHVTAAYLYTDFDQVPATFAPPHSDMGVDTDADTLFDVLEVGAKVNVTEAGTYSVSGSLYDGSFIDSASTTLTLSPGEVSVPINFTGWAVYASGLDGPYNVSLFLFQPPFTPLDFDIYVTGPYSHLDFERPPAAISPPHSDAGVDSDADGLFNSIAVDVSIAVDQAGTYQLSGSLLDSTMSIGLGFDFTTEALSTGPQTIRLEFSTLPMVSAGIAGPYVATFSLWTVSPPEFLDSGTHTTAAYTVSQFDPVPAQFSPPHADMGVDRDVPGDGEYNVLEVDARIDVTDPGVYGVNANLLDSSGSIFITSDGWLGPLSAGTHSVPLYFPGVVIRSSGIDGPYSVNMTLFSFPPGGFFVPIDQGTHTTQAYNATDFQSSTPATLSGTVRDEATTAPIPFASLTAFNYIDSLVLFGSADSAGNYDLSLYVGDWIVTYDDFNHQANLSRVSLTGATVRDVDLGPQKGTTNSADLTFATWDSADVAAHSIGEADNATFRLLFDWQFGNQDQFLDQQEFDTVLAAFGAGFPTLPASSVDMFLVDGTAFDLVPGSDSLTFVNVTGPIDSPIPPEFRLDGSYTSNTTIPAGAAHSVAILADYDTSFMTSVYTVHLPSPFDLVSFTASPAVSVSGLGTGTATVDPGPDPNPFDTVTSEWISLDAASSDATAPTVAGATAGPNPAEAGQPILFAATVTDDTGVRAVSVAVTDGSGAPLGNFTMTFNATSGKYEVSRSFAIVATLSFEVWASDETGNFASSIGSVVVRDTTAPTVTGATDSPDPVELGATVTISAQISDLIGIGSAKVEVRDPTSAVVGNFTMVHGLGTAYSYQFSPSEVGTYTYRITATDTSGNPRVVSGSFQSLDTAPPIADGGPDQSVNQGTTVTFDGTGSSDLGGIASYAWTFNDNGAVSLIGTNPTHRFDRAGTFTVTLTVTDPSGNSDTDTVVITVAATTGSISGTVVGPAGEAISGATVRLLSGTTEVATTTTNGTGHFTFAGVTPGSYTIRVEASGFETKTAGVSVTAGGVAPVSVALVALSGGGPSGLGLVVWGLLIAIIVMVAVALVLILRRRTRPPAP